MSGRAITALLALVVVLAIGWIALAGRPAAIVAPADAGRSVSGGGVTLTTDAIALPAETVALPAGTDLVAANCTACHSAEMLTTQPPLNADKWQATIDKMRGIYKAPIAPGDDKVLIAELLALPTQAPLK